MTASVLRPMGHDEAEDLAAPFVLGALDPDTAASLRAHLAACNLPHAEIDELGGVVGYLADTAEPIEPADALRARILDAAAGRAPVAPASAPGARGVRGRLAGWGRGFALAGLALVIVLSGLAIQFAGRLADAQAFAEQLRQTTALAAAPGSRSATLAPASAGGPAGVAVVVSSGSGRVVLSGLASTSGSQVYEVWLIGADGRPIPAGALHTTGAGDGWLDTLAPVPQGPVTVAVTREPGPGATTPTLPILTSGATD